MVSFFHMDAAGAAIATITAQAVSVLISLSMIRKRKLPFQLSIKDIRPKGSYIGHILKLGIPVAFQDMLVNISFLVIMAIVNSLGLTASAGVGVSQKMCGFLMLVPSAFMQSMSAFVAQNMGAGKAKRAKKHSFAELLLPLPLVLLWHILHFPTAIYWQESLQKTQPSFCQRLIT